MKQITQWRDYLKTLNVGKLNEKEKTELLNKMSKVMLAWGGELIRLKTSKESIATEAFLKDLQQ